MPNQANKSLVLKNASLSDRYEDSILCYMSRNIIILMNVFILTGCQYYIKEWEKEKYADVYARYSTSKYTVKKSSDDIFAKDDDNKLITLQNNYIESDDEGSLLEPSELLPYVLLDNKNNIIDMGFYLVNRNYSRWLNIYEGNEIIFLIGDKIISAKAHNTDMKHVSFSSFTMYMDFASYSFDKEQLDTICNADNIKIRVIGKDKISEYGVERGYKHINSSFYANNKRFFMEEILKYTKK